MVLGGIIVRSVHHRQPPSTRPQGKQRGVEGESLVFARGALQE